MNLSIQEYLKEAKKLELNEFLKKHPYPFLVRYIESYISQTDKTSFSLPKLQELIKIETQAQQKQIADIKTINKTERNPHTPDMITIGRFKNHDIVINLDGISKFHGYFIISQEDQIYKYIDIGSTNGSKINGTQIPSDQHFSLKDGDKISFANNNYIFYYPEKVYEIFRLTI